jgi:hypothetical protein
MDIDSIQHGIEQHGWTYADLDTPHGRVRVEAVGPRAIPKEGFDRRDTVVTVSRGSEVLAKDSAHTQRGGARLFLDMVERVRSGDLAPAGNSDA